MCVYVCICVYTYTQRARARKTKSKAHTNTHTARASAQKKITPNVQRDLSWLRPLRASETHTSDRFRHSASARAWHAHCHSLHVIVHVHVIACTCTCTHVRHNVHTTQMRTNTPGHQRHPIGSPQGWVLVLCPANFLRMSWPPERETRRKYDHSPKEVSVPICFDKKMRSNKQRTSAEGRFLFAKKGQTCTSARLYSCGSLFAFFLVGLWRVHHFFAFFLKKSATY